MTMTTAPEGPQQCSAGARVVQEPLRNPPPHSNGTRKTGEVIHGTHFVVGIDWIGTISRTCILPCPRFPARARLSVHEGLMFQTVRILVLALVAGPGFLSAVRGDDK